MTTRRAREQAQKNAYSQRIWERIKSGQATDTDLKFKEDCRKRKAKWFSTHREESKAHKRRWYHANPEKAKKANQKDKLKYKLKKNAKQHQSLTTSST